MPYALFSNDAKLSKAYPTAADVWKIAQQSGLVVDAVSELPRAAPERLSTVRLVAASLGVCTGGALLAVGIAGEVAMAALAGPVLAAFCAIPLLGRLLPGRLGVSLPCIAALVWEVQPRLKSEQVAHVLTRSARRPSPIAPSS